MAMRSTGRRRGLRKLSSDFIGILDSRRDANPFAVPKCKSTCPQRLNPGASIHLSSFAMSSSLFRDASEGTEMIVCSCNVFSDNQVRSVVAKEARRPRMSEVYAGLGCSAQCGRCAHTIKRIMDEGDAHAC
jgi:bacterioferritin-associated ferredoxin